MTKHLSALLLMSLFTLTATAQTNDSFPLWPGGAPGALGNTTNDIPTLTLYLPEKEKATGAAFVICPGGGYGVLAPHEGDGYARWFNAHGIAAFVLKYRLGSKGYRHPAMLQDVARALRTVRARADEWGVDSHRIGVIGSSAGGHLASTLLTHFDAGDKNSADPVERASSRPDLGILCYAVITMKTGTHGGSKKNLLGTNPPPELELYLSSEMQVTTNTPPCFIWSTTDDPGVPVVENSLAFAAALRHAQVPCEVHLYEHGRHGLGLGTKDYDPAQWHPWTFACADWLKTHGFIPAAAKP